MHALENTCIRDFLCNDVRMKFIDKHKSEPRVHITVMDPKTRKSKGFTVVGTTVEKYIEASKRFIEKTDRTTAANA